jgi:hypothetical protein
MSVLFNIFKIIVLFLLFPNSHAGTAWLHEEETSNILRHECKVDLGKKFNKFVVDSEIENKSKYTAINLSLSIKLKTKLIVGKMSFSCAKTLENNADKAIDQKKSEFLTSNVIVSAEEIIKLEDAGGRYYRIVSWEKEVISNSNRWSVAYVNSIFGDRIKSKIPDFFLACPSSQRLSCVNLEITNRVFLTDGEKHALIKSIFENISLLI